MFRLIELIRRHFVQKKPIWVQEPDLVGDPTLEADQSVSQYTGGVFKVPGNPYSLRSRFYYKLEYDMNIKNTS